MATQPQLLNLRPLATSDDLLSHPRFAVPVPEDVRELQADVVNVFAGLVDISTFSEERQKKVKDYYKFAAVNKTTNSNLIAARTGDTLDLV